MSPCPSVINCVSCVQRREDPRNSCCFMKMGHFFVFLMDVALYNWSKRNTELNKFAHCNPDKTALMERPVYVTESHSMSERRKITRGDFQSSGIFCFMTTKRNSWTFAWLSGAVLWSVGGCVCVCIKKLFWTGTALTGLQSNIHGCWSTRLGFNYSSVNMWKLMLGAEFCLSEQCDMRRK